MLFGRDREQQILASAIQQVMAGSGEFLMVSGEAGIGKTSLVRHAARHAQSLGCLVLDGGCYLDHPAIWTLGRRHDRRASKPH